MSEQKYREMDERYHRNALAQLRQLAAQDKPLFLNYWLLYPLTFVTSAVKEVRTLNGGAMVESIVEVDSWIGEILAAIDHLVYRAIITLSDVSIPIRPLHLDMKVGVISTYSMRSDDQ